MENTTKEKRCVTKTINIPKDLYSKIQEIAAEENRNVSNCIVNELIKHFSNGSNTIGQ